MLNGVPTGNVTLQFTGPGVNARATISDVKDQEVIRITVRVSGSQAIVNVMDRHNPQNGVEVEGVITSINTGARTLVVNGRTISVPINAAIRHGDRGLAFTDLKVGQRVHVKGTADGSTVVASEVKLQDENETEQAEAEGTVSALSGGCPMLMFMVKLTKVTTSAGTQFRGASCSGVANGVKVEVRGTRQTDGSIAATGVTIDHDND